MLGRILGSRFLAVALALFPVAAHAGTHVNIGINLSAPPPLVAVPSSPVVYAPSAAVNYFSYGGQFYVFANGGWYVSGGYNGPWTVIASASIPPPILAVPVRYYRARPPAWRSWPHDAPPRWGPGWGRGREQHGNGKHG